MCKLMPELCLRDICQVLYLEVEVFFETLLVIFYLATVVQNLSVVMNPFLLFKLTDKKFLGISYFKTV